MMNDKNTSKDDSLSIEKYLESTGASIKTIKKNHILQRPGSIANRAFYVKSGLLRSYTIDDNGKIHVYMFAPEGWLISDVESHMMSVPSELFIDAMEDSQIYEINQVSAKLLEVDSFENTSRLFRRIAVLQRRVLLLMSASAKKRYEHFIETYPQLTNRVPLKMIASYLGITPEALSNIRSKMRKSSK